MARQTKLALQKPFGRGVSVSPSELALAQVIVDAFASGVIFTKKEILELANMSGAPTSRAYKVTRLARDVSDEPIYAMARDRYKNLRTDPIAWDKVNRAHMNRAMGSLRIAVDYMLKLEVAIVNHPQLSGSQRATLAKALLGRRSDASRRLLELNTALEQGPKALGPGSSET